MAILTIDEARAHCRVESDYPADQLQPYMDAAESYVVAHLNRAVFTDGDGIEAAHNSLPGEIGAAYEAYQQSMDEAADVANPAQREAMIRLAKAKMASARLNADRVMNAMVVNGAIRAAMLLTLGSLFVNRETDVVGVSVAQLPTGVPELLRPYRAVQMP